MKKTVVLADDHPLVCAGLKRLLTDAGLLVVGEAQDGEEARRKVVETKPDLVLWDLLMPGGGLGGLRKLREMAPEAKILVLTALDTPGLAGEVQKAGAQGFVRKTADPKEILVAIETVLRGETFFPKETTLTPREEEILSLLAQGLRLWEIAERLGISPKTVESHLENLREKLGRKSVTELRALALRRIPTDPPSHPER